MRTHGVTGLSNSLQLHCKPTYNSLQLKRPVGRWYRGIITGAASPNFKRFRSPMNRAH